MLPMPSRLSGFTQQVMENLLVNFRQGVQVFCFYPFINLMNGVVTGAKFPVPGPPVGAIKRPSDVPPAVDNSVSYPQTDLIAATVAVTRSPFRCQEGLATEVPLHIIGQVMTIQQFFKPGAQAGVSLFCREAEVTDNIQLSGNYIGGTSACLNVGNLEAGGRKKRITLVPLCSRQLCQSGS